MQVDLTLSNALLYHKKGHPACIAARKVIAYRSSKSQNAQSSARQKGANSGQQAASESGTPSSKKPQASTPKAAAQSLARDQGAELASPMDGADGEKTSVPLGTKVEVLFSDGKWYEGTIEKYTARSDRYTIKFPDGDVQTAKLPDKDVRLVGKVLSLSDVLASPSPGDSSRGKKQLSSATPAKASGAEIAGDWYCLSFKYS